MSTKLGQVLYHIGFTKPGSPEALLRLMGLAGGPIFDTEGPASQIEAMNSFMQEHFLRKSGTERREATSHPLDERKNEILVEVRKLGLYEEKKPKHTRYNALLLHGDAEKIFRERIKYACELIVKGCTFQSVYLLGGQRELWPFHEPDTSNIIAERTGMSVIEINKKFEKELTQEVISQRDMGVITEKRAKLIDNFKNDFPTFLWPTEIDMMKRLAKKHLKGQSVTPINAPKKPNGARPNTHDAVVCWKGVFEKTRRGAERTIYIAAISTAPQGPYQHNVLCGVQTDYENNAIYEMETVTPPYDDVIILSEFFDAVARMVYAGKSLACLLAQRQRAWANKGLAPLMNVGARSVSSP